MGGKKQRQGNLFADDFTDLIKKKMQQQFNDIPNVYQQYRPHIENILENAAKGKLKELEYICTDSRVNPKLKYL